ncbi:hypothetical protein [Gallaecimonas pentaromativorans]|uniref:hypothetical protein n=1 Tax=Gallaecimonas pentaromativorans TaxID=584787 RepID=UPI003A90970E
MDVLEAVKILASEPTRGKGQDVVENPAFEHLFKGQPWRFGAILGSYHRVYRRGAGHGTGGIGCLYFVWHLCSKSWRGAAWQVIA